MTIERQLVITCDVPSCAGDVGYIAAAPTRDEARIEAARYGWVHSKDCDYCPKHGRQPKPTVRHHISGNVTGTVIQAGIISGGLRL